MSDIDIWKSIIIYKHHHFALWFKYGYISAADDFSSSSEWGISISYRAPNGSRPLLQ